MYYFIMKTSSKGELQEFAFNRSSDIDFRDFTNFYNKSTAKPCSFVVINTTLAPAFRKDIKANHYK